MGTRKLFKPELVGNQGIRNFHLEQLDADPVNPAEGRFWFSRNRGKLCYSYKERTEDTVSKVAVVEDASSVVVAMNALYGLPSESLAGILDTDLALTEFITAAVPDSWAVTAVDFSVEIEDVRSGVGMKTINIPRGMVLRMSDLSGPMELGQAGSAIYTHEHLGAVTLAIGLAVDYDADNDLYKVALLDAQYHTGTAVLVDSLEWLRTAALDVIDANRWTYSSTEAKTHHSLLPSALIPFGYGSNISAAAVLSNLTLDIWTCSVGGTVWTRDDGHIRLTESPATLTVTFTEPTHVIAVMENKASFSV